MFQCLLLRQGDASHRQRGGADGGRSAVHHALALQRLPEDGVYRPWFHAQWTSDVDSEHDAGASSQGDDLIFRPLKAVPQIFKLLPLPVLCFYSCGKVYYKQEVWFLLYK